MRMPFVFTIRWRRALFAHFQHPEKVRDASVVSPPRSAPRRAASHSHHAVSMAAILIQSPELRAVLALPACKWGRSGSRFADPTSVSNCACSWSGAQAAFVRYPYFPSCCRPWAARASLMNTSRERLYSPRRLPPARSGAHSRQRFSIPTLLSSKTSWRHAA